MGDVNLETGWNETSFASVDFAWRFGQANCGIIPDARARSSVEIVRAR